LYGGECHARAAPEAAAHDCCNFGYARDECRKFPKDALFDAVRFAITARDAETIQILYIFELDHRPCQHGLLTYHVSGRQLTGAEGLPLLEAQARAFVDAFDIQTPA
jgi:hypothetical protein